MLVAKGNLIVTLGLYSDSMSYYRLIL